MKIKIGDIKITNEDIETVIRVLNSNRLSESEYVKQFERDWANAFYIACHQYLSQNDLDYVATAFQEILRNL